MSRMFLIEIDSSTATEETPIIFKD